MEALRNFEPALLVYKQALLGTEILAPPQVSALPARIKAGQAGLKDAQVDDVRIAPGSQERMYQ